MHRTSPRRRALRLTAIACLTGALAVSLGGTGATAAVKASSASGLSGSWSGTYGGGYSGTFKLHWTQSAATLRGSIWITYKGESARTTVTGKLSGTAITFGAVGPVGVITYTGSVWAVRCQAATRPPRGAAAGARTRPRDDRRALGVCARLSPSDSGGRSASCASARE